MPKVSIIIPTYNRASYLEKAIESILSQCYQDFEIVVTDNNSTDNTKDIIEAFKTKTDKILYRKNDENIGVAENHNKALSLCTGDYIHVFSDDDIMLPNCLKIKTMILDNYPSVGLLHSGIETIGSNGKVLVDYSWVNQVWKHFANTHQNNTFFKGEDYHSLLYKIHNLICMPSVMIRKAVIDKVGFFSNKLTFIIDWHYWLKITLFYDVFYIAEKTIKYRIHSNSISTKSEGLLSVERKLMKKMLKQEFPKEVFISNSWTLEFLQSAMYHSDYSKFRLAKFALLRLLNKIGYEK